MREDHANVVVRNQSQFAANRLKAWCAANSADLFLVGVDGGYSGYVALPNREKVSEVINIVRSSMN